MMLFPKHGTQIGASPLPTPDQFPSTQYPNALNPFASPLIVNNKGIFGNGGDGL
jgi:hypothetical protein